MPKKILIADDEPDYPLIIKRYIERPDFDVITVTNGKDVYRRLLREPVDLVLLDFQLRDLNGNKVCDMIKTDEKFKSIPIFIITGHREVNKEYFEAYGANEVIYKPIDRQDLLQKIEKYLGSNRP